MKHSPLVRKATYIIGFTGIILGVLLIAGLLVYKTWFLPDSVICDQWLPSTIYPAEIAGTVVSIAGDPLSPDSCRVQVEIDNFGALLWCNCYTDSLQIPSIQIGDSISKEYNSILVTVCSPSSTCATLAFPCCD